MCIKLVVPENIHSSPKDGYWKYQGMQGISNTYQNFFRGKYEAKQEFAEELRGLGSNQKPLHGRGWIFSGTTQCEIKLNKYCFNLIEILLHKLCWLYHWQELTGSQNLSLCIDTI